MRLVDLLAPERVVLRLRAESLGEAAEQLATVLVEAGAVTDAAGLREAIRSPQQSNLVTSGQSFLLHFRTTAATSLAVAIGVTEQPVKRERGSEQEARIVILLVAPPRESSARLRAVGAFALVLARQEVVDLLLGAASPEDIVGAAPLKRIEVPAYLTVRDVMDFRQLGVRSDTTLGEASRLMLRYDVPQVPVVSDTNEVLGVITHRELLKNLLPLYVKRLNSPDFRAALRGKDTKGDPHQIPVREVMDRTVLCVSDDQSLAEVATMMVNRNVERFPVVREGALMGSLTRGDIVRRLLGP